MNAIAIPSAPSARAAKRRKPFPWVPVVLCTVAFLYLALFLFIPLATVFVEAFKKGVGFYVTAITEADTLSAIKLTLIAAAIFASVPGRLARKSVSCCTISMLESFALMARESRRSWRNSAQGVE